MPVISPAELEKLIQVLVYHRQYPSDDWDAVVRQVAPRDARTRENFREYMHLWQEKK